ncbi:hypothetical protein GS892_19335 [Rhodococcus hoagii]|nr:hypothetical protein [Prescottella equi]
MSTACSSKSPQPYTALGPDADVTDEQIQNTRYWMLGQSDNPLEAAP